MRRSFFPVSFCCCWSAAAGARQNEGKMKAQEKGKTKPFYILTYFRIMAFERRAKIEKRRQKPGRERRAVHTKHTKEFSILEC